MSTDDYGQGVNIASLADAPNAELLAKNIANGIAQRSVMRFASSSARSATLTAPVDGMATWLQDVDRLEVYTGSGWVTPQPSLSSTTSGLSVASGFSQLDFFGFRQGRNVTIDVYLTRTGSNIVSTNGNIADTVCCTLPSGWRPTHDTVTSCFDNGIVHGGFVVGTDGICTLRTASDNISNATNLRLHVGFLITT
ncbi:hypothetical protein OG601_47545 [Streptomyces sp. NBC_01239]|uniref:hypothetical protein n=1 Tax=Streptomyces sp. NBC_01239 TaxID=2903792 RepID=UPI0022593A38|nr:hypothetical protein [Streptomyces sp. NBC_01239]MCX4816783.1 hypothetical protein [Streptomyces sp. NBC_01239]MCX4818231.1 hypothetical protein [Streptomyces sp. NBC_01239]